MRRCVWSGNLKNEEAMVRVGPQRHKKKKEKEKEHKYIQPAEEVQGNVFPSWYS